MDNLSNIADFKVEHCAVLRLRLDNGNGSSRHESWTSPRYGYDHAVLCKRISRKDVISVQVKFGDEPCEVIDCDTAFERFLVRHPDTSLYLSGEKVYSTADDGLPF
jgi:hypothetical protein